MDYFHVDVFSDVVLAGNGLTVVLCDQELEDSLMLKLTKEFKQFETIFLIKKDNNTFYARIFTVDEELDFAGHPILGAAATIHSHFFRYDDDITIYFQLKNKMVVTNSRKSLNCYSVKMNQGEPQFLCTVNDERCRKYIHALNLSEKNLSDIYPMEVVSTGLPYLLVPINFGIENAEIICSNFEEMLKEVNAKFAYIFNVNDLEGRTWDNQGCVEDVATGSAAGPLGGYLYKHNIIDSDNEITINQGRFVGRPSKIKVYTSGEEIIVEGNVVILVKGNILNIN